MTQFERRLIQTVVNGPPVIVDEIEVSPPEDSGLGKFYAILRPGTLRVLKAAETLLRDDPEIVDPLVNPQGYYKQVMEKYGIYGHIPEMDPLLGYYHLTKLVYIATSEPEIHSPGFKPPALQHFIGLNDPIDALLHCAEILTDQANHHQALRPAFVGFPAQQLYEIDISGVVMRDQPIEDLRYTVQQIDGYRQNHLKEMLSWQGDLDS